MFTWARNCNGLVCRKKYLRRKRLELQWFGSPRRYPCSFEQGITLVWRAAKSMFVKKVRNYNGLGALAGIHVHLSEELDWFGCRREYVRAFELGITMVWEPWQVPMFI